MTNSTRATARGSGRIFKPKNSVNWHCAYYSHGREIRESTGVPSIEPDPKNTNQKKALQFLKGRVDAVRAERAGGPALITPAKRHITVDQLLTGLENDYKARSKWRPEVASNVKHLRAHFGNMQALAITKATINSYRVKLKADEYRDASINRKTQILLQAFTIAELTPPKVSRLPENNTRLGFFEQADLQKVLAKLPDYLRDFVLFASITGWRKGSCSCLEWIDVTQDKIILPAIHSKNRVACSVPLCGEVREIVNRRRRERVVKSESGEISLSRYVFHQGNGVQIGDFRRSWKTALKQAGVAPKLFHDLRRTAARNLVAAGVPESVAMSITNHKTRAMFSRYAITSENQRTDALLAVDDMRRNRQAEMLDTIPTESIQ